MKIKNKFLIALILSMSFILNGCTEEKVVDNEIEQIEEIGDNIEKEVVVEKRQVDGGEMRIAIMPPKTLNPLKNEDIYVDRMLNLIFDDLYILDEQRKPKAYLIETSSPNYVDNTLTLTLKNNLIWHDGEKVTSDDFIYSLDILKNINENAIYKDMVSHVIAYGIIDDLTIVIQYDDSKYLNGQHLLFPIIPKHYYESNNIEMNKDFVPLGNSYFKFKEQIDSKNYTLIRDENKENMAFIDTIKVVVLRDRATELYSFERSNIDLVVTDLQEWGKYQMVKTSNVYEYTNQIFEFIGFNLDRMIISDKSFRELIAHSIDKNEISSRLYLSKGKITNTFVNPDSWLYETSTENYENSFDKIQEIIENNYEYDESANTLYKNINGLRKEVSFTIIVNEDNSTRIAIAEYLKNNLTNYGIKVVIQSLSYEEYIKRIEMGNFDLVIGGYRFDIDQDPTKFLVNNIFNYNTSMLNSRINAFNEVVDEESYKIALGELQKLTSKDLPFISLLYSEDTVLTDENLIIPEMPSYSNLFSNVNEWYWIR